MLELTEGLFLSICIAERAIHRKIEHLQLHGQEVATYQYWNTDISVCLTINYLVSYELVHFPAWQ